MAEEQKTETTTDSSKGKTKQEEVVDPEFFSCILQPSPADSDPNYVGIRRLLLYRKAQSGSTRLKKKLDVELILAQSKDVTPVVRDAGKDWRCNGKGYVAYRNFINRSRNWESLNESSRLSTPGHSGRMMSPPGPHSLLFEVDSWRLSKDLLRSGSQNMSQALSYTPTTRSNASDSDRPHKKSEPAYSFVGMHCIFDQCKAMVTVVKFGHMSSDLLAYGAADGTLTVCSVSESPSISKQLIGHSKDVTDFDFTSNNQYIASSSLDKTVRIWEISKGLCIRVIYGVSSQQCIRFHPGNNNFLSVGNANKEINVFNFSTGRVINKAVFDGEVTAMDHDHTGQLLFCGDAKGCIYTSSMNSRTGVLSRSHRNQSGSKQKSPVTTVQYRTFSLLSRGPVLLTFTRDGSLSFFSVSLEIQGYLTLRCSLRLAPRLHSIRASFCPLLSLEKGEYIVVGSEDASVYFYDLTRPKNTCVNKLQGHCYPVIGIAWNHGENLLASSDFGGTVIIWKRAKTK